MKVILLAILVTIAAYSPAAAQDQPPQESSAAAQDQPLAATARAPMSREVMETKDILSLSVATLAFLVALAGFLYTVYSNRANRQKDDLQKVRSVVVPNVGKFNGIVRYFNQQALNKQSLNNPAKYRDDFLEAMECYREARDAYKSYRLSFEEAERKHLDALLDKVTFDPNNPKTGVSTVIEMGNFMKELRDKLN